VELVVPVTLTFPKEVEGNASSEVKCTSTEIGRVHQRAPARVNFGDEPVTGPAESRLQGAYCREISRVR